MTTDWQLDIRPRMLQKLMYRKFEEGRHYQESHLTWGHFWSPPQMGTPRQLSQQPFLRNFESKWNICEVHVV